MIPADVVLAVADAGVGREANLRAGVIEIVVPGHLPIDELGRTGRKSLPST